MIKTIESTNVKDTVQKIQSLNIPDGSTIHITIKTKEPKKEVPRLSKWGKVAQKIEALDISADTWSHIDTCRIEFRKDEGV